MFKILSGLLIMLSLSFSANAVTQGTEETAEINIHTKFGFKFERALVIRPEGKNPGDSLVLEHMEGEALSGNSSVEGVIEIGYFHLGKLYPLLLNQKGSLEIPRNLSLKHPSINNGEASDDLKIPHTLKARLKSTTDWSSGAPVESGDIDVYKFERVSDTTEEVLKYTITSDIEISQAELGRKMSGDYKDISTLTVRLDLPGEQP